MRRLAEFAAVTFLLAVGVAPVARAQADRPGLDLVAPETLAVSGTDEKSDDFSLWLSNDSDQAVVPQFAVSLEDDDGTAVPPRDVIVTPPSAVRRTVLAPVPADGVARYRLRLVGPAADDSGSGQLVATAAGLGPASLDITVGPKPVLRHGVNEVLIASFALALVVMLLVYLVSVLPASPTDRLGTLDLDFKTSFASTLTAVGALLGTIISAGVLPAQTVNLSKDAFTALNLLFALAIVIAGVVYLSLQRSKWVDKKKDAPTDPDIQVRHAEGFVGLFMLACLITLWAVFGEMVTMLLLVDELERAKGFTPYAVDVFRVLLALGAVSLILYTVWRVGAIVWPERKKPTDAEPKSLLKQTFARPIETDAERPEDSETLLPKVSLL